MQEPSRVLVVEDDPTAAETIIRAAGGVPGFEVVAHVDDGDQAVAAVQAHFPNIVLMDIQMRRIDGIAATVAVRRLPNPPHVVMLTMYSADEQVAGAIRAGAEGYLVKARAVKELPLALPAIRDGEAFLSAEVTTKVIRMIRELDGASRAVQAAAARDMVARLTARQRDVLVAVARSKTNDQIATELFLSSSTVKQHISALLQEFGAPGRVHLGIIADRAGLLDL